MATLVNKMNREVKVIIPNMREFRVFYSDNEGSVTFFKRDWIEVKEEEQWKPSVAQMKALLNAEGYLRAGNQFDSAENIAELYEQLKKLYYGTVHCK